MKYFLFNIFSILDFFSALLLGLSLFRIRINASKFKKLVLMSVFMSFVSCLLNISGLDLISPFIQLAILIVIASFLLKEHVLYTLLFVGISYIITGVVQTLIVLIFDYFAVIHASQFIAFTFYAYCLQTISAFLLIAVSLYIRKNNDGYAFIPHEPRLQKKYKYSNKLLVLVLSICLSLIFGLFYESKNMDTVYYISIFFGIIAVASILMLFLSLKRDIEDSECKEVI